MDVAPSRGPQRVGKGYIAMPPGGGIHAIKISASLTQDLVGLTELAVLSLQGLELGGHVRGQARLAPAVSLGPANPLMQRLRRAADLRGNRSHRRPPRGMILLVLENQPNRARAHFRRKSVRCLACHRSTFSRLGASGKPGAVQSEPRRQTGVDVAERKQVQEAIQTTVDRFGRLDVMFNNAGFNKPAPFMDVDEDNFIERVGRDWARRRSAPAPAGSPRKARRLANVRRSASKPRWMRSESCAFLGVSNVSSGLIAIPDLARPSRAGQKRSDDSPALRAIGWASASWRFGSRPQGSSTLGGAIHV